MTSVDLATATIAELGALIEGGEASPVEVMVATLERIDHLNGDLNAFISIYPDMALQAAREAEAEIAAGKYRGPLHGIPIGIKDLVQVAGTNRTCGSKIIQEPPSADDATCVAALKSAGAVIVGLLNLNEFAFGPSGINPHHGSAKNPWDRTKGCGGSSAGAGCATAAALVPGSIGTDTGGSVRIPAAMCGVVGLKQSFGLVSRHGIYPLSHSFDHAGPLTRTVRDSAIMLQAMAGSDPYDETTRGVVADNYSAKLGHDVKGLRVGVPNEYYFDGLHPDIEARVRAAIIQLGDIGAEVHEVSLPDMPAAVAAWSTMTLAEAYFVHQDHLRDHPGEMAAEVEDRLLLGKDIKAFEYVAARDHQRTFKRQMANVMANVDIIVAPTTPLPAVDIKTGCAMVNGESVDGNPIIGRLTRLADFSGQPAISVPCGLTDDGLPVGLQLIGDWFDEANLLVVAEAYEQSTQWHQKSPPGLDG